MIIVEGEDAAQDAAAARRRDPGDRPVTIESVEVYEILAEA